MRYVSRPSLRGQALLERLDGETNVSRKRPPTVQALATQLYQLSAGLRRDHPARYVVEILGKKSSRRRAQKKTFRVKRCRSTTSLTRRSWARSSCGGNTSSRLSGRKNSSRRGRVRSSSPREKSRAALSGQGIVSKSSHKRFVQSFTLCERSPQSTARRSSVGLNRRSPVTGLPSCAPGDFSLLCGVSPVLQRRARTSTIAHPATPRAARTAFPIGTNGFPSGVGALNIRL